MLGRQLGSGPLPLRDALRIAADIGAALEAAHAQGIVHRDLKPANVKLTVDERVKVLDFGLAKAVSGDTSGVQDVTRSPTLTGIGTIGGVILGTAAYMSPEQARGKPIDKLLDVWAFGCVLFEMLSGRRAFAGETVSDTLVHVLEHDPDWAALPAGTPPAIQQLVRRCLHKDKRQRLQDVGDARIELRECMSGAAQPWSGVSAPAVVMQARAPRSRTRLVWISGTSTSLCHPTRPSSRPPSVRPRRSTCGSTIWFATCARVSPSRTVPR